ncbi:MBL fold metallo-hydrolase [Polynucleobacter sp. MWH-Braz-FAM2G]|uniref:MBL fold metallo-hydrolase n=1 Tax=Polynucleobacter sp. MWH-Braz-FAM2G TaxID=1855883 RepID=UPI001BFD11CE|nr:MBL fold metallo-hydrolase [Polynucleobacter sp. MWH-Braz-FAM2G]QWD89960.1 MBL fold metallo-hydrolase [Polynucleobacter sp. MWH-Braz-FAM2G]
MPLICKADISPGVFMVDIPAANLHVLCGCPPDCVKHLIKAGVIQSVETNGVAHETGPNAILLSDFILQNESFANMAEFPVLQMLYRQGMLIPNHPNNTGIKPLLIGNEQQINAQLNYIYRGNYGLISPEEMLDAGARPEDVAELMRIKLKFAFGQISDSKKFLDTVVVEQGRKTIRNGVTIERLAPNIFEFQYQGEALQVDLNLKDHEKYLAPISLESQAIDLADFAVIHSGEGDGWDIHRTAMSSVILYQGKIYLIDAGPSVMSVLRALGIGLNEIAGLFHTHSHDDHFAGLPDIIRSDRRLKYYATPLVRASVMKKLCALMAIDQSELNHYLDFLDLETNEWNDIDGLEVRPIISPHPVETTIFQFRTSTSSGYKSYSHLADIASFEFIDGLTEEKSDLSSFPLCREAKIAYLETVDVKKIDIGGGLIHGVAKDFSEDESSKLILAHTSLPLTSDEKRIGVNVPFASMDVLIPAHKDYELASAKQYLLELYPDISLHDLQRLLDSPIVRLSPDHNLLPKGVAQDFIYLVLRGYIDLRDEYGQTKITFSAGTVAGELATLLNEPAFYDHIATSYVYALKIPAELYREIASKNHWYSDIAETRERRLFLLSNWLFEDGISYVTLNRLVQSLQKVEFAKAIQINLTDHHWIYFIKTGEADIYHGTQLIKSVGPSDLFGAETIFGNQANVEQIIPKENMVCYRIDSSVLSSIPVCRWKLLQSLRRAISSS